MPSNQLTGVLDHATGVHDYEGRWSQAVAWWLLLVGCATVPWTAVQVGSVPIADGCMTAAAFLLAISPGRHRPGSSTTLQVTSVMVLIAAFVAAERAVDPTDSLLVGARLLWILTLMAWTVRRLCRTAGRVSAALTAYTAGAVLSALTAVWQVRTGSDLVYERAAGLTGHVNDAGGTLAVAVAVAAAFVAHRQRPVSALVVGGACAVGLVCSGSVTGMAAAVIGVVTVLLLRRLRPPLLAGIGAGAAGAWWTVRHVPALAGAVDPLTRYADATGASGATSTLDLRIETWRYAWAAIIHNPLTGAGLDVASGGTVTFSGVTTSVLAVHNLFLLAWYQGGILLVGGFVALLVGAVRGLRRPVDADRPTRDAVLAGLVAAVVFAMTAPVLFHRYFWLPVLLAYALDGLRHDVARRTARPRAGSG